MNKVKDVNSAQAAARVLASLLPRCRALTEVFEKVQEEEPDVLHDDPRFAKWCRSVSAIGGQFLRFAKRRDVVRQLDPIMKGWPWPARRDYFKTGRKRRQFSGENVTVGSCLALCFASAVRSAIIG